MVIRQIRAGAVDGTNNTGKLLMPSIDQPDKEQNTTYIIHVLFCFVLYSPSVPLILFITFSYNICSFVVQTIPVA